VLGKWLGNWAPTWMVLAIIAVGPWIIGLPDGPLLRASETVATVDITDGGVSPTEVTIERNAAVRWNNLRAQSVTIRIASRPMGVGTRIALPLVASGSSGDSAELRQASTTAADEEWTAILPPAGSYQLTFQVEGLYNFTVDGSFSGVVRVDATTTSTPSVVASPSTTPSAQPTSSATATITPTSTPTATMTPTIVASPTITPTPTNTPVLSGRVTSESAAYNSVWSYLDTKVQAAATARAGAWDYDYESVDDYLSSVEGNRERLRVALAIPPECLNGSMPAVISDDPVVTYEGVVVRKLVLGLCEGSLQLEWLIASPQDAASPSPLIIGLYGTCGTPERALGLDGIDDYQRRFAFRLAQAGYVVAVPNLMAACPGYHPYTLPNQLEARGTFLDQHVLGIWLGQIISGLDYLSAQAEIAPARIGTYGISLGGLYAMHLAAVDERIEVAVVSGWVDDRTLQTQSTAHPYPQWALTEHDFQNSRAPLSFVTDVELGALIVPRKLFVEYGSNDVIGQYTPGVYAQIADKYDRLGLRDYHGIAMEQGGHEAFLLTSLQFLNRWLQP